MKGKKILVTGGAGFIGSHLCRDLIKEGTEVLVIDNLFTGSTALISKEVEFKRMDIRSPEVRTLIKEFDPDVIVHLAAVHYIPYCNANPGEAFDVNVMGTRNLVAAAGDRIFFFASSAAVYPDIESPLSEDVEPAPIDIYGKTKLIGEDLVKLLCKNAIIARIFNVYGKGDTNPHLIPVIIEQIKSGGSKVILGNLTPKRDYIHVDDVCRAIITLLRHNKPGIYNIGTGKVYSVLDIINIVSQIVGRNIEIVQDESRKRKVERRCLMANITKIKKLGWKPIIDLRDGLKELLINESTTKCHK